MKKTQRKPTQNTLTLDELLETISVADPLSWENETGPKGWYALIDDDGIIAYFGREADAFAYRLYLINLRLNGGAILNRYA